MTYKNYEFTEQEIEDIRAWDVAGWEYLKSVDPEDYEDEYNYPLEDAIDHFIHDVENWQPQYLLPWLEDGECIQVFCDLALKKLEDMICGYEVKSIPTEVLKKIAQTVCDKMKKKYKQEGELYKRHIVAYINEEYDDDDDDYYSAMIIDEFITKFPDSSPISSIEELFK